METKYIVESKNENGWATVSFASLEEATNYAQLQFGKVQIFEVIRKLIADYSDKY